MTIQNVQQLLSLPTIEMIEAINELPDSFNAPEAISEFANHFGVNPNYLVGRGLYPLATTDGSYVPLYGKYGEVLFLAKQVSTLNERLYTRPDIRELSTADRYEFLYFIGKSYTHNLIEKISDYARTDLFCTQETINYMQPFIKHSMESLLITVLQRDPELKWLTIASIFDDLIANQHNWAQAKALRFALVTLIQNDGTYYLRKLLKAGLDINAQDENGITILMIACSLGKDESVEQLLEFEASIDIEDSEEMNAYDHSSGNTYIHALLNETKAGRGIPTMESLLEESYQSS